MQVKGGGWRRMAEMGGRTPRRRKGKGRNGGFLEGCNSARAERTSCTLCKDEEVWLGS